MPPLRLIFAGTPGFAASHLEALLQSSHQLLAVYTQPDRPAGRGKKLLPSPVKQLALQHDLPVLQPPSLKSDEELARLKNFQADLMVVVAYGLILPQAVLDIPRYGCVNVHASLLPRWRGAAPVERAILAGDSVTGVTIMQMDAGLDTGPMLYQQPVRIGDEDTRVTVEEKLTEAGREALLYTLDHYPVLRDQAQAQGEAHSTYARKVEKHEALIDWNQPAEMIHRQVRAGIGRYPAWSFLDGERVRILEARVSREEHRTASGAETKTPGTLLSAGREGVRVACGDSSLILLTLQLPGKTPAAVSDLLNSRKALFSPGKRFIGGEEADAAS